MCFVTGSDTASKHHKIDAFSQLTVRPFALDAGFKQLRPMLSHLAAFLLLYLLGYTLSVQPLIIDPQL